MSNTGYTSGVRMDQIVECFPNTLLKLLPDMISKTKWNKKAKEVETWEHWWEMHAKVCMLACDWLVSGALAPMDQSQAIRQ